MKPARFQKGQEPRSGNRIVARPPFTPPSFLNASFLGAKNQGRGDDLDAGQEEHGHGHGHGRDQITDDENGQQRRTKSKRTHEKEAFQIDNSAILGRFLVEWVPSEGT